MIKRIVFSICFLLIGGCQQELTVENDLNYNEKIVIQGLIRTESSIIINLTKTEPLTKSVTDFEEVGDAKVFINYLGTSREMPYIGNGQYSDCNFLARAGIEYELMVDWNGKSCKGSTSIPGKAKVNGVKLHVPTFVGADTNTYIECDIQPEKGYIYGAVFTVIDEGQDYYVEDTLITNIKRDSEKNEKGILQIKSRNIPKKYYLDWRNYFYVKVYAFDEQIYKYYLTQYANLGGNNIFSSVGTNLRWNITGDGIGLFIGYSSTEPLKANP